MSGPRILGLIILSVLFTYVVFLVGVAVFGLGRGMYEPPARALLSDIFVEKRGGAIGYHGISPALQAFLMDRFPDERMGGDFGAVRTMYLVVGSFGPAYAGFVASTIGFVPAFTSFLVFYLTGAIVLLWFAVTGWPTT